HPFSLSYGVILPSSLTRVLPLTFEYSSCLPVSVSGTGTCNLIRGFSWQRGIRNFVTKFHSPSQLEIVGRIFLSNSLTALAHISISAHSVSFCVSPSFKRLRGSTGISTCYPLPTPFGLSLGPTNPEWTSLPQETLDFRLKRFSLFFRYSYRHSHFYQPPPPSRS